MGRVHWATTAVLAAVGTAAAGPVDWSYSITSGAGGNAPFLDLGTVTNSGTDIHGNPFTDTRRAYNPVTPSTQTGTHTGDLKGAFPGDPSPLNVGGVGYPVLDRLTDPYRDSSSTWQVRVEITDAASGQTGTATFSWIPWASPDVFNNGGPGVVGWTQSGQTGTLVLGDNRYTILTYPQERESWTPLLAEVAVTANTPEPATLLMAGTGVAGLILARRRRK